MASSMTITYPVLYITIFTPYEKGFCYWCMSSLLTIGQLNRDWGRHPGQTDWGNPGQRQVSGMLTLGDGYGCADPHQWS